MFVNRSLDNSEPLAKISPEILQKIETVQTTIGVATSNSTANTIVKRDGSGYFATNKIRVQQLEPITGVLDIAKDDTTTTLNLGSGTGVQTINVGNSGTGKTTIKLGGGTDEVLVNMPLKDTAGVSILNVVNDNTHVGKDISTAGTFNTAVGTSALKGVTVDATLNTAVGVRSLEGLTTGTHNVAMGYRAGSVGTSLTTGTKCVLIGADARTSSASMTNSVAIGFTALVDADNTIQLGNNGVVAVKTSGTLYAAGLESAGATPTILNIASLNNTNTVNIGSGAGVQAINVGNSGNGKTTITLGSGTDEVKVNLPLKESVNGFNILSITSDASAGNTSLGSKAMASWTGSANTYIGSDIASLGTGNAVANTVVGSNSMKWVSTGSNNCAMGHKSLESLTTGANNVAIGFRTGFDAGSRNLTTGNQNVLIGSEARTTSPTMNNAIAIGYMSLVDADNTIQLGNTSIVAVKTSGTITAAAPTADTHLTTKLYVDNKVTAVSNQPVRTTDTVTFAGLILPNAGGSASTLNHYEEYVHSTIFSSATFTGNIDLLFVRIGKLVTMTFPYTNTFTATSTTQLGNSVIVPERFRPFGKLFFHMEMVDNSVRVDGLVEFNGGFIIITPAHSTNFITGRTYTLYGFSMSWVIL